MKAHINGITIEGTPQEIMEYQRLQAQTKPVQPSTDTDWMKHRGKIVSGGSLTITQSQMDGPVTISSKDFDNMRWN